MKKPGLTILVVEDDAHIALGLGETLRAAGYQVRECRSGSLAERAVEETRPALVLLDVMLPGKSGFDVCRDLRARGSKVPIILLTARGQELDKVMGLKSGADDYVTKPFGLQELLARIEAVLRRAAERKPRAEALDLPDEILLGTTAIRPAALRGECDGRAFELTPREMRVLGILWRERGNAVPRGRLLDEVWGEDYEGTARTLDQVILKLRQKIETAPAEPRHLLTVHGLGYRLEA